MVCLVNGFRPSVHGFPFPNCWPAGMPVLEIPTPIGRLPIGDASGGVCGGMIFAAADYFLAQMPRPAEPTHDLFKFFCRRLLDSWHLPFGMLKYYDWQRRPMVDRIWSGVLITEGSMGLTRRVEWPKVKAVLDAGNLAPLGLVQAGSWNPRHLGRHHQTLAYDYQSQATNTVIRIYDPNYPNRDDATLTLTAEDQPIIHSIDGPTVRGFFLTEYSPTSPIK